MQCIYVGLDTATVSGVSIYFPDTQLALVCEVKGTPVEQLHEIMNYLFTSIQRDKLILFSMEKQHNFLNANTTRSLLERYGYFKYTLEAIGYAVREVSPSPVRSHFGVKSKREMFDFFLSRYRGKHLTNNHTDALAIAMYQAWLDGHDPDLVKLEIHDVRLDQGVQDEHEPG